MWTLYLFIIVASIYFRSRNGATLVEKDRMIFESVPGKQVTLAHIISNPDPKLFEKLGLDKENPNG